MTDNSETSTRPVFGRDQLGEYLRALQESVSALNSGRSEQVTFEAQWGRKFIRIVQCRDGVVSNAHAFVEISTGALLKAASWQAPQRNSDGALAKRFDLLDDESRRALCDLVRKNPNAVHGGYLYAP